MAVSPQSIDLLVESRGLTRFRCTAKAVRRLPPAALYETAQASASPKHIRSRNPCDQAIQSRIHTKIRAINAMGQQSFQPQARTKPGAKPV